MSSLKSSFALAFAASLPLFAGCAVEGFIDGPAVSYRHDAGPTHGDDPPPDDPPDDPTDTGTAGKPDTGGTAPPPPDSGGGAPPPPADTGGGAPPPPTDSGAADTGATDTAPPDTAPPPPTTYPSGPYGTSVGNVFPNATFSGYRDGTGTWGTLTMQDYYDPDGKRGIKGVLLVGSASWCGPCQEEAKNLASIYPGYKTKGARFLGGLIEDSSRNPATKATVDTWVKAFKTNYDMVADPEQKLLPAGGVGIPYSVVINPRTMKVEKTWSGADPYATSIPQLDTVIAKNGG